MYMDKALGEYLDTDEQSATCSGILQRMSIVDKSDPLFNLKKMIVATRYRFRSAERFNLLSALSDQLKGLNTEKLAALKSWNKGHHEKLITALQAGLEKPDSIAALCRMYRWGDGNMPKDTTFVEFLLEQSAPLSKVSATPEKFPKQIVYAHGCLLNDKWNTASSPSERKSAAFRAIPLFKFLSATPDDLGGRSIYFLTLAFLATSQWELATTYLIETLQGKYAALSQRNALLSIFLGQTDIPSFPKSIENLLLSNERVLNPRFWDYFCCLVPDDFMAARIAKYAHMLRQKGVKSESHFPFEKDQEELVRDFLGFFSMSESQTYAEATKLGDKLLACADIVGPNARVIHSKLCLHELAAYHPDPAKVFVHATEALSIAYSDDMAVALQRAFIAAGHSSVFEGLCSIQARQHSKELVWQKAENIIFDAHKKVQWVTGVVDDELSLMSELYERDKQGLVGQLAVTRLATLFIRGECSPNIRLKIQRYREAIEYLKEIGSDPYLLSLKGRLEQFGFFRQQASLIQNTPDGDYIWLDRPGSDELIIAFADRFSHHVFPSVPSFVKERPANVLFLNNPQCNWYSDEEEERVSKLIDRLVLGRFPKEKVTCYHGSMGGYAAIRFAAKYGFSALTVNPQVNLDLWAADRPADAERILSIKNKVNLDQVNPITFEGMSLFLMISQNPTDFLGFQAFFQNLTQVRNLNLIIEKHAINEHEGVIMKAYGTKVIEVVSTIVKRLASLRKIDSPTREYIRAEGSNLTDIIKTIKDSYSGRWELLVRDGIWHIRIE